MRIYTSSCIRMHVCVLMYMCLCVGFSKYTKTITKMKVVEEYRRISSN